MNDEIKNPEETISSDQTIDSFLKSLNVSLVSGITLVPLIIPGAGAGERLLLSKLQLQDDDGVLVFEGILPLDVMTVLSLNLLKACHTALRSSGKLSNDDFAFIEISELRATAEETIKEVEAIRDIL